MSSNSVSSKWECVVYFVCENELVLTLLIEVVRMKISKCHGSSQVHVILNS